MTGTRGSPLISTGSWIAATRSCSGTDRFRGGVVGEDAGTVEVGTEVRKGPPDDSSGGRVHDSSMAFIQASLREGHVRVPAAAAREGFAAAPARTAPPAGTAERQRNRQTSTCR